VRDLTTWGKMTDVDVGSTLLVISKIFTQGVSRWLLDVLLHCIKKILISSRDRSRELMIFG
jgi:hypothetical protein